MMRRLFFITTVFFVSAFFLGVTQVHAASLSLSPDGGTYAVRQTFTVDVVVSSADQAVNAFSGEISYPTDKLFVVGVSKTNSIINFWTTEPKSGSGKINYEGVALNPGYTGTHGQLVHITFRALAAGSATLKFLSASVLANDGLGTSVISSTNTATYTITANTPPPESAPTTAVGVPATPIITSSTHPVEGAWYSARVAELAWNLPPDVTSVSYITNARPTDTPFTSFGRATGRSTPILADGVWYTHVRFANPLGVSPVADFKTQIDATLPTSISVKELTGPDTATKKLEFSATDALSGIGQFGVSLDGKEESIVPATGDVTDYTTAPLARGEHTLLVKAYDRAGNFIPYNGSFTITRLDPPVLTEYPKELRDQDFLIIHGTSYADTQVAFTLTRQLPVRQTLFGTLIYVASNTSLTSTIRTDTTGAFVFAYPDRLPYGLYKISARAVLADGSTSDPSTQIVIPVVENTFSHILHTLLDPTVFAIVFILAFLILLTLFIHTVHRYHALKRLAAQSTTEKVSG